MYTLWFKIHPFMLFPHICAFFGGGCRLIPLYSSLEYTLSNEMLQKIWTNKISIHKIALYCTHHSPHWHTYRRKIARKSLTHTNTICMLLATVCNTVCMLICLFIHSFESYAEMEKLRRVANNQGVDCFKWLKILTYNEQQNIIRISSEK